MTQRSQLSSLQMTELWFSEGRNEHEVIVGLIEERRTGACLRRNSAR